MFTKSHSNVALLFFYHVNVPLMEPCDSELSGWWFHLQRFRSFRKMKFILTNFISYQTMFLRPRPQISGYFLIRNFFFPDTASVHTYLVNPQYESATRADKCWAVKRALRSSFNVWCGVGLARALFPRFRCAWRPAKFSFLQTGNPISFL